MELSSTYAESFVQAVTRHRRHLLTALCVLLGLCATQAFAQEATPASPSVAPPSSTRAMLGWSSDASIWRSSRKRRKISRVARSARTSLIATCLR